MARESTKKCPFCGEVIHAEAVKCRFCREFLEDQEGLPVSHHARRGPESGPAHVGRRGVTGKQDEEDAIVVKPSVWGLLGFFFTAILFLVAAVFLKSFPLGQFAGKLLPDLVDEQMVSQVDQYSGLLGTGLGVLTLLIVAFRVVKLKSIHYEISPDRIEYARGIFSRKIDNLDMFRVTDIKLHRSLLDCLVGVGSVTLVTKDETDPFFDFEKIARPKELYDLIKKSSLAADRKQGVVHLD